MKVVLAMKKYAVLMLLLVTGCGVENTDAMKAGPVPPFPPRMVARCCCVYTPALIVCREHVGVACPGDSHPAPSNACPGDYGALP